jgi:DNA-binding response OmpR family regulator
MKILIVEDEWPIAMMLAEIVSSGGHQVIGPTADAVHAITLAETSTPELALVDIRLHDMPLGSALARHLMRRWQIPSIFITGNLQEAMVNYRIAIGVIEKPFTANSVLASIDVAHQIVSGCPYPAKAPPGMMLFPEKR